MSEEFPKAYDPKAVDDKWYEKQRPFFSVDPKSTKSPYCVIMPPPNVTGALHMGHALVNTLQDTLVRWKRMCGFEALWVPGTDHAGIATQTVVEKRLIREKGMRRTDFSREEFLKHVWEWKETSEKRITQQIQKLGCSCDWNRLRFTMDKKSNQAVRTLFCKLFKEGLIYRGDYLVNWDPATQTALADDEVEYEERQSFLWYLSYPLTDGSGSLELATTRPETMLGDTAVAVSPKDERYQHLVGKTISLPLSDREIPIIADHHVDPTFGTGVVKITPAHDPNDYEMGLSHDLPMINILNPNGTLNENAGTFAGLTVKEARTAVVEALKEQGFLTKVKPHLNRVGISYRSKATIEPRLSKQWFIKMGGFAKTLRTVIEEEKTRLIPKNWESTYFHWIDNLRDWCISRQLWWGHRIPIWYNKEDPEKMLCQETDELPLEVQQAPGDWVQEEDVLDTWFSSSLWPFSILGWPEKTEELAKFYPNAVLITGHDILFFWVARMLMMGDYALDTLPFPETFLHGLIYGKTYWREDADKGASYVTPEEQLSFDLGTPLPDDVHSKWEKMSKSKGNVIDPLEMIDRYGTDAVRMALCFSATQAREIDLDRRRFEEFKNFANKIWNGARFIFRNLDLEPSPLTVEEMDQGIDKEILGLEDRWILSLINHTIHDVNHSLSNYAFDQAAAKSYNFFWKDLCSYYLEISKPFLFGKCGSPEERKNKQKILTILLCLTMRLIHPIAPFISEELFQRLKKRFAGAKASAASDLYTKECLNALQTPACVVAPYPQVIDEADRDAEIEQTFSILENIVYTIRNIRGEMNIPPSTKTDVYLVASPSDPDLATIRDNQQIIHALIPTDTIYTEEELPKQGFLSSKMTGNIKVVVPLPYNMIKQEKERLSKEYERLSQTLEKIQKQLGNSQFLEKAPKPLVDKQRSLMERTRHELDEITHKLQTQ